jgi:hypothetical protein
VVVDSLFFVPVDHLIYPSDFHFGVANASAAKRGSPGYKYVYLKAGRRCMVLQNMSLPLPFLVAAYAMIERRAIGLF